MALCDHWDFALAHAVGDYFIFNGDDDCISSQLLDELDRIAVGDCQLISWHTALYFHPDWDQDCGGNILQFGRPTSGKILNISIEETAFRFSQLDRSFFPEATRFCCKRSLANKIIRNTGRLFWPLAIDITAPLLLVNQLTDGQYLLIDSYMGFGGRNKKSNAAAYERCSQRGSGGAQQRAKDFYEEHGEIDFWPWHPLKTKAYWNAHAAAWSLCGHWSNRWNHININWPELLGRMLAEAYGISNANPFLSQIDIHKINRFMWTLSENDIKKSFIACLNRISHSKYVIAEVAENNKLFVQSATPRPEADSILRLHAIFTKELLEKLKVFQMQTNVQSIPTFTQGLRIGNGEIMLQCEVLNIKNAYDLTKRFDEIIEKLNPKGII